MMEAKKMIGPEVSPLTRYLTSLDGERHLRRLRGDRLKQQDEDFAKVRTERAEMLKLLTPEERDIAVQSAWRADPAEFDKRAAVAGAREAGRSPVDYQSLCATFSA